MDVNVRIFLKNLGAFICFSAGFCLTLSRLVYRDMQRQEKSRTGVVITVTMETMVPKDFVLMKGLDSLNETSTEEALCLVEGVLVAEVALMSREDGVLKVRDGDLPGGCMFALVTTPVSEVA